MILKFKKNYNIKNTFIYQYILTFKIKKKNTKKTKNKKKKDFFNKYFLQSIYYLL